MPVLVDEGRREFDVEGLGDELPDTEGAGLEDARTEGEATAEEVLVAVVELEADPVVDAVDPGELERVATSTAEFECVEVVDAEVVLDGAHEDV